MIETVNPATGASIATYEEHDADALTQVLARAWSRWQDDWRHRPLDARLEVLGNAAKVLEARRDELAALITAEMGKPITAARAEVDKCAWLARHTVERAADDLAPRDHHTSAERSYVRYDPIGPVLAIMPWNFPLWQVFRFAAPNLAAGNVGLLKHASSTTGCALAIADVLAEAGCPRDAFQVLLAGHDMIAGVLADDRVRGVTLTGSDGAGRAVAAAAGEHLKKTVLELGGSDPLLVLDDADLDAAASGAVQSRYLNSGQSCINAKRVIVARSVYEDFVERFVARVEDLVVGDPTAEATDIGPLARADLRDTVHDQVRRTLEHHDGGELVLGGEPLEGPGFYYAPTVLRDVNAAAPAAAEEVFGPVAALLDAESDEAALALANGSRFGLGAAVWSGDLERAERMAAQLEAGMVFVNEVVKSDPRLPFGGVKDSGYGRELATEGAREFTNIKTVWVTAASAAAGGAVE